MTDADRRGKLQSVTAVHGRWYGDACGAAFGLELVGERWALLVVREMMLGARRFSDLRASLPGISAKTLTDKLDWLEQVGVVERTTLPPPGAARLYGLTEWGKGLEEVLQVLGRWAVRSDLHDPTLAFSPVSFLLSLRTMFDPTDAEGMDLWIAFAIAGDHFAARLRDGCFTVHRASTPLVAPDLRFTSDSTGGLLALFYGPAGHGEGDAPVAVQGDPALARRFVALFGLPEKTPAKRSANTELP